jgi:hypothetical protein
MAALIIPVLLSLLLGPGVGQLYNKEYKKGALLIALSAGILIWAVVWYSKAIQPFLPSDMTTIDPQAMPQLVKNAAEQVRAQGGGVLLFFKGILTILWLYGVVDAYWAADKKRKTANGRA